MGCMEPPILTNIKKTTQTYMHVQYKLIPCSGFKEVKSLDTNIDADAGRNPFA